VSNEEIIRIILESWAENTRLDKRDVILANHAGDALIFDVLPPMHHEGTAAYRANWDLWQPETVGESTFSLRDLRIAAGEDVAFATAFIDCAGALPDGRTFSDMVRATFCLERRDGHWQITHQHISKPFNP
jgi:ketosteroid isomerase-like protein